MTRFPTTTSLQQIADLFERDMPECDYLIGKCNCGHADGAYRGMAVGPRRKLPIRIFDIDADGIREVVEHEWEAPAVHGRTLEEAFARTYASAMEYKK